MSNTEEKKGKVDIQSISELVENAGLFDSRGFSVVKVTRCGEKKLVKLPIRSAGVAEYQAELSQAAPRPPVTKQLIKRNSAEGKALGLPHDTICIVFDTTDEDYVNAMDKHNEDFAWRVAVFALDLDWKKADGTKAETFEEKKKILQSNGITGYQRDKIYNDVGELTRYAEKREDFLSKD